MIKTAQKKRKLSRQNSGRNGSRQIRLGVSVLVFIVALIVCGKLLNLAQSIDRPFSPDSSYAPKSYTWSGQGRINLAVRADNLYLLSFDSGDDSIDLLKIPEDTYLDLSRGFGRYPARSVYSLGQSETPPIGAVLLKEGLSKTFSVPVDGYLILSSNLSAHDFEDLLTDLRQNPLNALTLLQESKTDLSIREYLNLTNGLRGVRSDKVEVEDIGQSKLTSWVLLPDGSRVLGVNKLNAELFVQDQLPDSLIKSEEVSVGVYNATNHPQLAEKAADVITNMGGNVIFTASLPEKAQKSYATGKKTYTLTRLNQLFGDNCLQKAEAGECQPDGFGLETSRADINLVLGEDYYLRGTQK